MRGYTDMKKIFAVFLTLTMLTSLCCCGKKEQGSAQEDLYKMYTAAEEKTNSLSSYYAKMTQSAIINSTDGSPSEFTMESVRQANLEDETDPEVFYRIKIYRDGDIIQDNKTYYKDNKTYSDTQDGMYYVSQSAQEIVSSYKAPASFSVVKEAFAKAELITVDSGKSIYIKPGDSSLDSFAELFASAVFYDNDETIADTALTIEINEDGYLSSLVLKFTAYNDSLSCDNAITIEFVNPGAAPKITPPENIEKYPSLDEYEASLSEETDKPTKDTANNSDAHTDTQTDNTEAFSSSDTSEWDGITDEEGEAVDAAFALFDEDYNKVANFDELYKEACEKYGKETMDSIIEVIMALSSLN